MSVIRAGSNPEKLYIYGTDKYFYFDTDKKIEIDDTYGFFEKFLETDAENSIDTDTYNYNGISIWMDWVNDEDGRNYKVLFQHISWNEPIVMWEVTWQYILNNFKIKLDL